MEILSEIIFNGWAIQVKGKSIVRKPLKQKSTLCGGEEEVIQKKTGRGKGEKMKEKNFAIGFVKNKQKSGYRHLFKYFQKALGSENTRVYMLKGTKVEIGRREGGESYENSSKFESYLGKASSFVVCEPFNPLLTE